MQPKMTHPFFKGYPVYARGMKKPTGKTTGGTRHCGLEGCTGKRIGVRWEDGKLTWPCTKGMNDTGKAWEILNGNAISTIGKPYRYRLSRL